MKKQTKLLCTRPLSPELLKKAAEAGVTIDCLPFIKTEPVIDEQVSELIAKSAAGQCDVVITSMNAAEAVIHELKKDLSLPNWHIYTMGGTTKDIIKDYWGELADVTIADDASSLADKIISENPLEVMFFSGNISREELPAKLQEAFIKVEQVVVYNTTHTPHSIVETYDGILFFSPSAVESFFSTNAVPCDTVLFAIGTTTATSIESFSNNKVVKGDAPGKDDLVNKAITYFQSL